MTRIKLNFILTLNHFRRDKKFILRQKLFPYIYKSQLKSQLKFINQTLNYHLNLTAGVGFDLTY